MNAIYRGLALGAAAIALSGIMPNSAEAATTYRSKGPTQVITMKRNAIPRAIGVRQVYTNGQATTVSGSLVTDYVWGRSTQNARVYRKF